MKSISRRTREQNTFTNYMRCIIPVYFFLQWMFAATLSLCLSPFLSFFPHLVAEMLFSFSFIITYFISLYLLKFYSRSRFQSLCVLDAPYLCVRSRVFFFSVFFFVSFLFFSDAVFLIFVFHLCPCSVMVDFMIYKIVCDFCPVSETERIYCSEAAHNIFFSLSMFHTFVCDGQVDYKKKSIIISRMPLTGESAVARHQHTSIRNVANRESKTKSMKKKKKKAWKRFCLKSPVSSLHSMLSTIKSVYISYRFIRAFHFSCWIYQFKKWKCIFFSPFGRRQHERIEMKEQNELRRRRRKKNRIWQKTVNNLRFNLKLK